MRGEHVRQALVHLRRLVRTAAYEHDAVAAQAVLHRRPVDEAGLQLLLDPDLREARGRVLRALRLLLEQPCAVAVPARPALAAAHPAGGLRPAHDPAGAVHRREERLLGLLAGDALEDHGLVAHRAAHEALLTRPRGRAT